MFWSKQLLCRWCYSLTHRYPRKHLWTFVAGQQENFISSSTMYIWPSLCILYSTGSTQLNTSLNCNCWQWLLLWVWYFYSHYSNQFYHADHLYMVSSMEQSREGIVELLVYHGSTRHYPIPPCDYIELRCAVIRRLVMKMFLLAFTRFTWNNAQFAMYECWTHCCLMIFSMLLLFSVILC